MTIHTRIPSNDDEFFTTKDAAELMQLSHRTLERMRVEGGGPPFVKAGNGKRARVLYLKSDLIAWLKGRRFDSTSEYSYP